MSRKRKRSSKLFVALMILFILLFVVAAAGLFLSYWEYHEGDDFYTDLSRNRISFDQGDDGIPVVDFDALRAVNPDIVAWIYQEGTGVNYPVVHGSDNEYYLDHMLNGDYNKFGTPFVDSRIDNIFDRSLTIIYGHNMKNGSMFACLTEYKSQQYYDAHPTMLLLTPEGNYRLELFSGFTTGGNSGVYQWEFSDDNAFLQYIADIKSRSNFRSDVSVAAGDRVVMLSTCAYNFEEARYVVYARMHPMF